MLADWAGWRTALAVYPPLLRNKVAIVTGANSGTGLETTKALLLVCVWGRGVVVVHFVMSAGGTWHAEQKHGAALQR